MKNMLAVYGSEKIPFNRFNKEQNSREDKISAIFINIPNRL